MTRPLQLCPACKAILTRRHYDTCPKVDRERKKRDVRALRAALKRIYAPQKVSE